MTDEFHPGTFTAGLVFTALGIALMLEVAGVWSLQLSDLAVLGPISLITIGIAVLASSVWHGSEAERTSKRTP